MYRLLEDIDLKDRNLDYRLVNIKGLKKLKMYVDDFMKAFNRPKYMYIFHFLNYLFDRNKYFIYYKNEKIGNCMIVIYEEQSTSVLYDFSIKEDFRGKRLSSGALFEILFKVKEQGIEELCLEVNDDNAIAINLYENSGFKYESEIE
jgi:ribosomal protein S18 acetylase RimI-like enzyme